MTGHGLLSDMCPVRRRNSNVDGAKASSRAASYGRHTLFL